MAVPSLSPIDDVWERAAVLGGVARALLATRIVCCLLVTVWVLLARERPLAVAALCVLSFGLLVFLLRWSTSGVLLSTHPAVLALDMLVGFFVLAQGDPPDPSMLVVATGTVLIGLFLDRRGTFFFAPLVVAGWWLVYLDNVPDRVSSPDLFNGLVLTPALLVGGMVAGVLIRGVILLNAERERGLREQVRSAGVAEERARLAREMHDSLTKSLHGVAMMTDSLPRWIEADPERAKEQAATVSELITRSAKDSRALIVAMRRTPATASVAEMVRRSVERWRSSTGREATLTVDADPRLSTESAYELAAILNEALENISRHTPETATARVRLDEADSWVGLVVADDGGGPVGGRMSREGHFGMLGMRERAERVGGELLVDADPGVGVVVTARIPAQSAPELPQAGSSTRWWSRKGKS